MTVSDVPPIPRYEVGTLLTIRGLLLGLVLTYLAWGPVLREVDIVAAMLVISLGTILVITAAITFVSGLLCKRQLSVKLTPPGEPLHSLEPTTFVLEVRDIRVLPFFALTLSVIFEEDMAPAVEAEFSSVRAAIIRLPMTLSFPHRGEWKISFVHVSLSDRFGFTTVGWKIAGNDLAPIRVYPHEAFGAPYPIISSRHRPGDSVIDTVHRHGDPFDLKAYHPSDGLRKVVWKIYAKTGQLFSRHPEPSMTPEGEVVIFVAAGRDGDTVAAAAVDYAKLLDSQDLVMIAGCDGLSGDQFPTSSDALREALVESVWAADGEFTEDLKRLIELAQRGSFDYGVHRLIIFASIEDLRSSSREEQLVAAGAFLEAMQISPVYFFVKSGEADSVEGSASPVIRSWFLGESARVPMLSSKGQRFYEASANRNWYVVEGGDNLF